MEVKKESEDVLNNKIKGLKDLFPEIFTENQIDFDKFKSIFKEDISKTNEKYSLNWVGKSESIKNIQTNSKLTLVPDKEGSINFDSTENIFIEGDNLEVLKLLNKSYFGKIKMIYIDPPYNTGNDFVYNDDFKDSKKAYLEQTGQTKDGIKQTTNTKAEGRYHSNWLSMMYPRLFIARNLLKEDGVIFVSIDDNEVHNLRHLMDEIFGEDNFLGCISWRRRSNQPNDDGKMIAKVKEYILAFSKNLNVLKEMNTFYKLTISDKRLENYSNPDNDLRGDWSSTPWCASKGQGGSRYIITTPSGVVYNEVWLGNKKKYDELLKGKKIFFPNNGDGKPRKKIYKSERISSGQPAIDFWVGKEYGDNLSSNKELGHLFDDLRLFDYPKPTKLISNLLKISSKNNDLILDFFAGSGTTAHAVLDLNKEDKGNRKFICVQLPEIIDEKSIAYKEGYKKISDIAKERIKRVINKIKTEKSNDFEKLDLGFKSFILSNSNYSVWNDKLEDIDNLKSQLKLFESSLISNYKDINVIYEILIKEGLSLNSNVEKLNNISNKVYQISDSSSKLYVCLDNKIDKSIIKELNLSKEDIFICLDSALDDSLKQNLSKVLESNEFKNNLKTI